MKTVCFGEIMLRLNPKGHLRFLQANELEATYSGAEANVAVSLANYGVPALFVGKTPEHDIGQAAVNALRRYGVDTTFVVRGGDRLGIYFVEKGASQRASKVIYDRAGSALATAGADDFDWPHILAGAKWFHFTGITPALNDDLAAACKTALQIAQKMGVTTSCDLNYRKNLWSREKAGHVLSDLLPLVNVCIANEEDTADVFGIHAEDSDVQKGELSREGYVSVAQQLAKRFGLQKVAVTLRGSLSASDNRWSGMLYDALDQAAYFATDYAIHIVDRVGGGDAFAGGLIYALLHGHDCQRAVDFATAASCLQHSVEHDFNLVSVAEVEALMRGDASGRVRR